MADDESIELPWYDKTYDTGIRREEGRFRFLYGIFGAADFALLIMLINIYLTSPSPGGNDRLPLYLVIGGLCAMALAAGMDFTTWVWYVIIGTFIFLAGVIATAAAIYFLLDQLDPYAGKLFLALSLVIVAALALPWALKVTEIWRDSQETARRRMQETTGPS